MNVRYKETAGGGKYFWVAVLLLLAFVAGVTTFAGLVAESSPYWYLLPGANCAVVLAVLFAFRQVSVEVRDDGISAWLGPIIRRDFPRSVITSLEVERYNWKEFGGWGWKRSWKGAGTFSAVGIADCLRINLNNGKSFVVTLHNPQACKDAFDKA